VEELKNAGAAHGTLGHRLGRGGQVLSGGPGVKRSDSSSKGAELIYPKFLPNRGDMGQHRIQRQILQSFSFQGRQTGSRETWWLGKKAFKPQPRSIDGIGFFEVGCAEQIDQYITDLENGFKEKLSRFSRGEFRKEDVGRDTYDLIAMHYVRSQACRIQIEHMAREYWRKGVLTHPEAEGEYLRLTSHQDLQVFHSLVNSVASTLTHYVMTPILVNSSSQFLTSDKIVYAGQASSEERQNFVWFPMSPSIGLALISDNHTDQILGPTGVNRRSGRISFAKQPEAPWLRCQRPSPQDVTTEVVNTYNELMVRGSTELYATDCYSIDSALELTDGPTGYSYVPSSENSRTNRGSLPKA